MLTTLRRQRRHHAMTALQRDALLGTQCDTRPCFMISRPAMSSSTSSSLCSSTRRQRTTGTRSRTHTTQSFSSSSVAHALTRKASLTRQHVFLTTQSDRSRRRLVTNMSAHPFQKFVSASVMPTFVSQPIIVILPAMIAGTSRHTQR